MSIICICRCDASFVYKVDILKDGEIMNKLIRIMTLVLIFSIVFITGCSKGDSTKLTNNINW